MKIYNKAFLVESDVKEIFTSTWDIIRPHIFYMSLIWAIFYIPTNIFILMRSGDMMRHLNSGNAGVIPIMLILNLLGTIPNIALVLLVKQKDCDDYNSLVASAFKKLPYYLTTTFAMFLRMIPLMVMGVLAAALISVFLSTLNMAPMTQLLIVMPVILLTGFLSLIRYYSSINFYLMKGARNFRATSFSRILFELNRKKVLAVFGVCSFLPLALNFVILYLVDNEAFNIFSGFLLGFYMFLSSGFYAGLFNHIREERMDEILTETISESLNQNQIETVEPQDSHPEKHE
ncbi:hypothetical protein [Oceanispirochaeta sp.]|jgi:hypothetical protein|uniref:hypothetical protein n=1 Tax=Oceanispirochaeta sp. TaxID=2035350 RepID=UPI002608C7C6|nr:hypothetical protein [Oceanispirochaeta sp.]